MPNLSHRPIPAHRRTTHWLSLPVILQDEKAVGVPSGRNVSSGAISPTTAPGRPRPYSDATLLASLAD
ncbi:hypothetical protein THICB3530002 [Thiomonas sp. CB3]|nr:hypothetical protein THICB3530002 [Thiomonas sp. CB3]